MIPYAHDDADMDVDADDDEELERALFVRRANALAGKRMAAPPPFAQVLAVVDEQASASRKQGLRVRSVARAAAGVIAVAACAAALLMGIRPQGSGAGSGQPSIVAEPEFSALPIELVGGYSGEAPRENTCARAPVTRTTPSCASLEPAVAVCQGP